MVEQEAGAETMRADDTTVTPCYWLATVRRDGRPHVVPVLAVFVDGALHFVASPGSRKAHNFAYDRTAS